MRILTPRHKAKQLERQHQKALVDWFRKQYPDELLFSIPNGLIRSPKQASKEKSQGLVAGIPDLFLAKPTERFSGMFIEMKRPKTLTEIAGNVSKAQKETLEHLASRGYYCVIAFGWDEAREMIIKYMDNKL